MLFSLTRSRPFSACSKSRHFSNSACRKFRHQRDRSYLIRASSQRTGPMTEERKVLTLNEKLLEAIDRSDYKTYSVLCADDITCFEPESKGTLVEGMEFHKWFFDWRRKPSDDYVRKMNICQPKVRMLGPDAALVTYIRLDQKKDGDAFAIRKYEETRIWQIIDGAWTNVHYHRSSVS